MQRESAESHTVVHKFITFMDLSLSGLLQGKSLSFHYNSDYFQGKESYVISSEKNFLKQMRDIGRKKRETPVSHLALGKQECFVSEIH